MGERVNIESKVDMEEVPLCPLCDQPILHYEETAIGVSRDAKCLIHLSCAREITGD
jgi:hypothetical protein